MTKDPYDFRPTLLYQARTDAISWAAISGARSPDLYMGEKERVEMLLSAANGESFLVHDWHRFCGARLTGGPIHVDESSSSVWEKQRVPLVEEARVPLRTALEELLHKRDAAVPAIERKLAAITHGRVLRVMEVSEDGEPRDWRIAESIGVAVIDALRLLLTTDYRVRLRQCASPTCGKFAFGTPPRTRGQPPSFYCSAEHRDSDRRRQSTERQAASRAGMAVERFRKRQIRRK